jgi:pyruvate dehydrogenase E2 component (dihydrolipoamide acetyltransferase)
MATLLRVPEVAAGATEVVLSEWLVEEGGDIAPGDPVVVVETEKAIVEVEADSAGVVLRRLAQAGTSIDVGSPLVLVGPADESGRVDEILQELGVVTGEDPTPAPERREVEVTDASVRTTETATDPESGAPVAEAPTTVLETSAPSGGADAATPPAADAPANDRIFASPISRRLLTAAGISLASVAGTGPNGRITRKDAELALAGRAAEPDPSASAAPEAADTPPPVTAPRRAAPQGAGFEEVEHSRLRRAVAGRLTSSKQTVPHFYVKRTVRIDELLRLRAQLNDVSATRISVNDLVVRAVGAAHVEVPEANVIWTDDAMREFDSVDVGVAISSDRGLVTPVLRSVESTTPSGVARRIRELVQLANDGKLQQRDLEGGSISVTNLGMFGVEEFSAIINPPQSAILAVGAATPQPVVTDGEVGVATVMTLVLSVDHRAVDGALAARWMAALVTVLEQPMRLLA